MDRPIEFLCKARFAVSGVFHEMQRLDQLLSHQLNLLSVNMPLECRIDSQVTIDYLNIPKESVDAVRRHGECPVHYGGTNTLVSDVKFCL